MPIIAGNLRFCTCQFAAVLGVESLGWTGGSGVVRACSGTFGRKVRGSGMFGHVRAEGLCSGMVRACSGAFGALVRALFGHVRACSGGLFLSCGGWKSRKRRNLQFLRI